MNTTPDGKFTLVANDGDGTLSFEGYSWLGDADYLPKYRVEPRIQSFAQLLEALAQRRLVMVISRFDETGDEIRNVWITDDAEAEKRGADVGEVLELRYWDGTPYQAA